MTLLAALLAATYDWIELFPSPDFGALDILLFVAALTAFLATLPPRWRWKTAEEKQRMLWILPRTNADLSWWAVVSLVAGIVEEIVYRGVMVALLQRILGSWALAVIACVAVFTVSHWVQGWRAMVAIAVTAVVMHLVVRWTGDLYTAMAVHAVYDFFAGVIMLRLARRGGLTRIDGQRGMTTILS
jgi:membrane protease YdiL (CAAX protease family)